MLYFKQRYEVTKCLYTVAASGAATLNSSGTGHCVWSSLEYTLCLLRQTELLVLQAATHCSCISQMSTLPGEEKKKLIVGLWKFKDKKQIKTIDPTVLCPGVYC